MRKIIFIGLTLLLCTITYGQKKEVAVLKTVSTTVNEDIQGAIQDALEEGVVNSKSYTLVARGEAFRKAMREFKFQESGAVDDDQLIAAGHAMGADFVCYATIRKIGNDFRIAYKFVDVGSSVIPVMGSKSTRNGENDLFSILDEIAAELFGRTASSDRITNSGNKDGVTINGTTWAKKNVGAFNSEDYGNYYNFEESKHACPKGWRLPTADEFSELIKSGYMCTTLNGKDGRKFGDANNFIFLPAAGSLYPDGEFDSRGLGNYYGITGNKVSFLGFDTNDKSFYTKDDDYTNDNPCGYIQSGFFNPVLIEHKYSVRCVAE
jgi:uncharacterized protein (TIGR02145 family)